MHYLMGYSKKAPLYQLVQAFFIPLPIRRSILRARAGARRARGTPLARKMLRRIHRVVEIRRDNQLMAFF